MSQERTLLDDLDFIQREAYKTYESILDDKHVREANCYFLYPDVLLFFVLFKQGIDYSYKTYGEDCLASGLRLYSQFKDEANTIKTNVICYHPKSDEIQMTLLHIASACAHYGTSAFIRDSHLPHVRLGAETHTVLQTVEECYHRYQIHHLGYPVPTTNETLMYEQEITSVWQKALSDLNLQFSEEYG